MEDYIVGLDIAQRKPARTFGNETTNRVTGVGGGIAPSRGLKNGVIIISTKPSRRSSSDRDAELMARTPDVRRRVVGVTGST